MPYTEKVKFSSTNNYGCGPDDEDDVYTVEEFAAHCRNHSFVDYDGFGHPVRDGLCDPRVTVSPSRIADIPADATHVVWYNK